MPVAAQLIHRSRHGSADVYYPADDTVTELELDNLVRGRALLDVKLRHWLAAHAAQPLCVQTVSVDRCGGFVLGFNESYALEVFPNAGAPPDDPDEYWRLLQPGTEAPHFVMRSSGSTFD
jgi:hypothetical protein